MQTTGTVRTTIVGAADPTGPGVLECDASVVLVRGKRLNLWVGRRHFIRDPDGGIIRGQYVLVMRPGGGSVSRITSTNPVTDGDVVRVEHLTAWDTGGVLDDTTVELWPRGVLDGTNSEFFEAGTSVTFVRPTTR